MPHVIDSFSVPKARVEKILNAFSRRKILVFGDVGLDKYTIGKVSRISPEAPIPVVEVSDTVLKLGLASNVADNIDALGAKPLLVGVVGKDNTADDFSAILKEKEITDRYIVSDPSRKTTLKERVVAETQQVVRIDHETLQIVDEKVLRELWQKAERAINEADAVIIEDYAKGSVEVSLCRQIIQKADMKGIPILVDPNSKTSLGTYYGCTLITPNTVEAENLTGVKITNLDTLQLAGTRLLDKVGAKIVVITRGREGMAIFARGENEPVLIPTFAREVFDVSGAGDTVIATLALALSCGATIVEAALIANFAAGIEVGKRGTATVSISELRDFLHFVGQKKAKPSASRRSSRSRTVQ